VATNDQKTPLGLSLNRWARGKIAEQIQTQGRSLPCHVTAIKGSIVTVAFDVQAVPGQTAATFPSVTIPIIGSEYVRLPIQVGCQGMTVAADTYLGGVSGLGGGTATLARPPNLTPLAFVPLGNVNFTAVNGNLLVLYGVNGVTIGANSTLTPSIAITSTSITLTVGGKSIVINSSGITLDGVVWDTHQHQYVPGTGVPTLTGVPVA
jgi:hypothetical protein